MKGRLPKSSPNFVEGERDDITTEIFNGFAYYDKDFRPVTETTDKYSDLLILQSIAKSDKPNKKEGE